MSSAHERCGAAGQDLSDGSAMVQDRSALKGMRPSIWRQRRDTAAAEISTTASKTEITAYLRSLGRHFRGTSGGPLDGARRSAEGL